MLKLAVYTLMTLAEIACLGAFLTFIFLAAGAFQ